MAISLACSCTKRPQNYSYQPSFRLLELAYSAYLVGKKDVNFAEMALRSLLVGKPLLENTYNTS